MTFPRGDQFSLQALGYLISCCSLPHFHIWGVGGLTFGSEISLERQGAQIQQLYGMGSLPIKLQGWRFSPCKRLVKDFSLEEEIHLLFAQRLERAEEFYPFIWTADLRQSESVTLK